MTNMLTMQIHGVKSTLEYLRRFEPEAYKAITADMRKTAAPLRAKVAKTFPAQTGVVRSDGRRQWELYGHASKRKQRSERGETGYTFPRYDITQVRRGVKTQIGGRKIRSTNTYPILRIKQTDGAGAVFDMAKEGHSAQGRAFVGKITGTASRVMWPTVTRELPSIRGEIERILKAVERRFSVDIAHDMDQRTAQSARSMKQVRDALGRFGRMVG